ncbi:hypothetical protein Cni_G23405 [Canna indica]|uniref:rRNA methyltransferase 1, mitochondrial n=1 Tax=Canna indica TaxID=4628 RepID=A0AAQ3QNK1_9LILI|nr:hypothetical protein Cni_G23405 [Canna indica]
MYQCHLAKPPAIPFLSKISELRSSRRMVWSCFSEGLHHKAPESGGVSNPGSLSHRLGFLGKTHEVRTRAFSSNTRQTTPGGESDSTRTGEPLPWIAAAYRNREGKHVQERAPAKTKRSSWEQAAESFLAVNENGTMRNDTVIAEDEEDGEVEPIDDPRWDKIKNKYKGFVRREPRFEKPEIRSWNKHEGWERKPEKVAEDSRFEKPEVRQWSKQESWGKKTWKEATESSVPKMVGQGVYGVGPVLAALMAERREFYALYVQEGLDVSGNSKKKKDKKAVEKILQTAEKIGLKVIQASKHDLNMVVDNRPHQGLILDASPLEMVNIRELDPVVPEVGKAPLWLALDEVTDPQNLGAIIRSAYFFGAEGIVLCAKNSAPLSGVVSKASAGSLELIELLSCKNMMQFLSSSAENGWRVLGGSVASKARPLSEVEAGVPTILVLGSEGSGLRPLVERCCTQLIRIPGNAPVNGYDETPEVDIEEKDQDCFGQNLKSFLAVESLNVSVAAGVLLYQLIGKNNLT